MSFLLKSAALTQEQERSWQQPEREVAAWSGRVRDTLLVNNWNGNLRGLAWALSFHVSRPKAICTRIKMDHDAHLSIWHIHALALGTLECRFSLSRLTEYPCSYRVLDP